MKVKLLAYTRYEEPIPFNDRAALSLTAIRTCYSPLKPSEILAEEGDKYFTKEATDGEGGSDADRLFRHITRSGHTSTTEHINYSFAIEGVSRALLAQLTRHRIGFAYSVQSQRYVRLGSKDKAQGFEYVTPPSIEGATEEARELYAEFMRHAQATYDSLRALKIPPEDARMVLPNGVTCNLVWTTNLRALLDFYAKRQKGKGAQWEIALLAEKLREEVVRVDPWTDKHFEEASA